MLAGHVFNTMVGAGVLIEQRRQHYNTLQPHSSQGYQPPLQRRR
ncbi:integrase core domain-containing protein [Rhizosaccharibacter radicis]